MVACETGISDRLPETRILSAIPARRRDMNAT
jgi:hypothetical protein